jgi:hypothetical protein
MPAVSAMAAQYRRRNCTASNSTLHFLPLNNNLVLLATRHCCLKCSAAASTDKEPPEVALAAPVISPWRRHDRPQADLTITDD